MWDTHSMRLYSARSQTCASDSVNIPQNLFKNNFPLRHIPTFVAREKKNRHIGTLGCVCTDAFASADTAPSSRRSYRCCVDGKT